MLTVLAVAGLQSHSCCLLTISAAACLQSRLLLAHNLGSCLLCYNLLFSMSSACVFLFHTVTTLREKLTQQNYHKLFAFIIISVLKRVFMEYANHRSTLSLLINKCKLTTKLIQNLINYIQLFIWIDWLSIMCLFKGTHHLYSIITSLYETKQIVGNQSHIGLIYVH